MRRGLAPSRPFASVSLRKLILLFVLSALSAAALTGSALAFQDYVSKTNYAYYITLGPGGYAETSGFNYRTENDACRGENSGRMSVSYYNTSWVRVTYSGVLWTNCNQGADATIINNGYYVARCKNEGTVQFPVVCWAWNYSP
jgi:hypothetical protein